MYDEKNFEFDPGVDPWEQEKIDEAEKIEQLEKQHLEREKKQKQEEEKKEKLAQKKITTEEQEKLVSEAEKIKTLYALDYWMKCFNRVSYCNEKSGQALFHVCLGQALRDHRIYLEDDSDIDLRLHFLWIQDSGCLSPNTKVIVKTGEKITSIKLKDLPKYSEVLSYNFQTKKEEFKPTRKVSSGKKKLYKITLESGKTIVASKNHIFFDENGKEVRLKNLKINNKILVKKKYTILESQDIISIEEVSEEETYDLQVLDNNNFFLSNGILSHNSGKGKAMNFVNRVFHHKNFQKLLPMGQIAYKTHKLGRMNAASLINTYELDKNGRVRKDKETNKEVVKLGIIQNYDFIFSEEGRVLLESNKESFELQEILMTATETIGSSNNEYTKQLTNYVNPCKTTSTASFAITTRPFGKVKQTLVESGMIQRFIFYPRKLAFKDREVMNKKSSFAFRPASERRSFNEDFNLLITEMNKVVEFAKNNNIDFKHDDEDNLFSFLHEKMMWFTNNVEQEVPNEDNKYILQSFVSRYKENMVIMAFHSAIMRFSAYVERQDLQYAFDYFKELYMAQRFWVSMSVEEDKNVKYEDMEYRREIRRIFSTATEIITPQMLAKELAKAFNKEYNTGKHHVKRFMSGENSFLKLVEVEEGEDYLILNH